MTKTIWLIIAAIAIMIWGSVLLSGPFVTWCIALGFNGRVGLIAAAFLSAVFATLLLRAAYKASSLAKLPSSIDKF